MYVHAYIHTKGIFINYIHICMQVATLKEDHKRGEGKSGGPATSPNKTVVKQGVRATTRGRG